MSVLKTTDSNHKRLIIHADDAGLSHSQNRAIMQSLRSGVVNSYSIMVPCPWFYEIALFATESPQYDCGIHLTLTCEWKHYKFGPVLPVKEVPSLVDGNGYFHASRAKVKEQANPEEVKKELTAQIECALQMGVEPTHLDSHMYTLGLTPQLLAIYQQLGQTYGLPIFLDRPFLQELGIDTAKHLSKNTFCVDKTYIGEYQHFAKRELAAYYKQALQTLKPGLNLLLVHPAFNDPEMQAITTAHPNFGAQWRQLDFNFLNHPTTKQLLTNNQIKMVTWRDIT